jgi:fucose permease
MNAKQPHKKVILGAAIPPAVMGTLKHRASLSGVSLSALVCKILVAWTNENF